MLGKILRRRIKHGRLTIIRPDGHTEQFGELTAAKPRSDVAVRLKGALTSLKLSLHPDLYFGKLYVDGALIIERGTLWDLLELMGRNQLEQRSVPGNSVIGPLQAFLRWMRRGEPGLRVLDIGCGWGGLALSLAEMERVEVVGVTLSREQLTVARKR